MNVLNQHMITKFQGHLRRVPSWPVFTMDRGVFLYREPCNLPKLHSMTAHDAVANYFHALTDQHI